MLQRIRRAEFLPMRVYEISLAYKLVSLGESVILNTPEKVGD